MEIKGKITKVLPVKTGVGKTSGKPWMSQDYVIDCEDRDEQSLCITAWGEDRIKQLNIKEGQYLTAHLASKCKEGKDGRFFNDIRVWKVELDPTRVQPQ